MLVGRTQAHAARIDQPLSQHPGLVQRRQMRVSHRNLRVRPARSHRRIENRVRTLRQHLAPGVDVRLRIMPAGRRPTARHDDLVVVVVVHDRCARIDRAHRIGRNLFHRTRRIRIPRLRCRPIDRSLDHHRLGHSRPSITARSLGSCSSTPSASVRPGAVFRCSLRIHFSVRNRRVMDTISCNTLEIVDIGLSGSFRFFQVPCSCLFGVVRACALPWPRTALDSTDSSERY